MGRMKKLDIKGYQGRNVPNVYFEQKKKQRDVCHALSGLGLHG
jgi:hypothetical protein